VSANPIARVDQPGVGRRRYGVAAILDDPAPHISHIYN
jgi:uncharacterized protein YbjT (DUF2867 family)